MKHDIKDIKLSPIGKARIEWASTQMPVLEIIRKLHQREAFEGPEAFRVPSRDL
jgi:S-adenosylhomocysteine hydrolase